jgi:NADP-dependent 3-hydroxy acid dehydrogenase YdfG
LSDLTGSTAVVTGASRGIGEAVAHSLAGASVRVVRIARSFDSPDVATPPGVPESKWIDIRCDITQDAEVRSAAETVLNSVGTPDILVNCAGTFALKPFGDTSTEDLRAQLDVNLVGTFAVLKALLPAMALRGSGHVVTIGSIADHQAFPGNAAYAPSKFGVRALHEVLKTEFAGQGVRLTLISPGPTDTTLWDPIDPDRHEYLPNRGTMLRPSDVAEAVLFALTRPPWANVDLLRLGPS